MEQIILSGLSLEQLREMIVEVFKEVQDLKPIVKKLEQANTYLSRKEVAQRLKITLPTLHKMTKQGQIISYRVGRRILYKEKDIEEALQERNFTRLPRA